MRKEMNKQNKAITEQKLQKEIRQEEREEIEKATGKKIDATIKKPTVKNNVARWSIYIGGLLVLALGIVLNSKTDLGVSPIISFSYAVSKIVGWKFANVTFLWYCTFVLVEMVIHLCRKCYRQIGLDILQIPLSLIFTRFMDLFELWIPEFSTDLAGTWFGGYTARILFLILAIIFTGVGVAMSVSMRIIPNPGDGIVQALSDCTGLTLGTMKNIFDCGCIVCTYIVSYLVMHHLVGIGVGTILAMIGVGRTVALFNLFFMIPMLRSAGLSLKNEEWDNEYEDVE